MLKAIIFDLGDTLVPTQGEVRTFPNVKKVLNELKLRYKLAIICNANTATLEKVKEILRETKILHFFETVVVSTDVGYSKPDTNIFRITLEKLNVESNEAIMVGNRISTDILGGNTMGMVTVLVKLKGTSQGKVICKLEKPDYTIQSLKELNSTIKRIEKN